MIIIIIIIIITTVTIIINNIIVIIILIFVIIKQLCWQCVQTSTTELCGKIMKFLWYIISWASFCIHSLQKCIWKLHRNE